MIRPFLKWPGNKFRIVQEILAQLPKGDRLIEPFLGSGAVFLNSSFQQHLLADHNPDLIATYDALRAEGDGFIARCRSYFKPENNSESRYYELRDSFNRSRSLKKRAALFVYLNKHGYNGLCRYNSKGKYNVPFGAYQRTINVPEKAMHDFIEKSQRSEFVVADFTDIMAQATPGDVVYCDPPYVPLSETARFTSYSQKAFGEDDQIALAELARKLAARGVPVLLSNHDTPFTREIYEGAAITTLNVQRNISCKGDKRERVAELLALFV